MKKFTQFVTENRWPLILIYAAAIIIIIKNRKPIIETTKSVVMDLLNEQRINTLHPSIRDRARQFIAAAEAQGIKLRITSALRTFDEQNRLYYQGRTTAGKIVTNAKAGQSYHNYGLALDVVPIINGAADWNATNWNQIGQIGKAAGFAWGGDFTSLIDKPHFQYTFGKSTAKLLAQYNAGQKTGNYVTLA